MKMLMGKMLLGEEWVEREQVTEVQDPHDGSLVGTVPRGTREDLEAALAGAVAGAKKARAMSAHQRYEVLRDTAKHVETQAEEFAVRIAREGIKTIREARKEVARAVNTLTLSAEEAKRVGGEQIAFDSFPGGENRRGWYEREPLGVVAAITPFNDPLNLVAHKLGPAVAAGNATVLKPASQTPLSALALVEAFDRAGLPRGVIQAITIPSGDMGDALVSDERVDMVSFTGGYEAGKAISKAAGLKKIGMELGSNGAVLVWKDAELDWAIESCASGAFWAAGQNCIGVQRIYVHRDVYERFRDGLVEAAEGYRLGSKLEETTDMGPLIDEGAARRVEEWIQEATEGGAEVLTGGQRDGTRVRPTVLEKVPETARLHHQEAYGPTVNLYPVNDDLELTLERINTVPAGIHAAVFSASAEVAFAAARELRAAGVLINDSTDYRLDAMPFGGTGRSGIGREGVRFAIEEMTEPKVVCWNLRGVPGK